MTVIQQLNSQNARIFAQYCFEKRTEEVLRRMAAGPASEDDMKHWKVTAGEWEEAITAALADMEFEKNPPSE